MPSPLLVLAITSTSAISVSYIKLRRTKPVKVVKKFSMKVTTNKDGKKIRSFTFEGEVTLQRFMGRGISKTNQ